MKGREEIWARVSDGAKRGQHLACLKNGSITKGKDEDIGDQEGNPEGHSNLAH